MIKLILIEMWWNNEESAEYIIKNSTDYIKSICTLDSFWNF